MMSVWHLLIVLIATVLPVFPALRILKRTGFSPWWAVLYVIPLVSLIALFVFAYSEWPVDAKA